METILRTENLCKIYGSGENQVYAVRNADIEIKKGEFAAIIGKSGSGKSTLLHMLGGLDYPTSGRVYLRNEDIFQLKEDDLAVMRRRKIGFIFQAFNLVSSVNVWENVVLPMGLDGQKIDVNFVQDILHTLNIENKVHSLPNTLSGGQQQRVAIARALASEAKVLLADEPTGNLDETTTGEIIELLKQTAHELGKCVIVVTHSREVAQAADHILKLDHGTLI